MCIRDRGLYWSLKAKLGRFTASVSSVMCETGEDGSLTPDGQAKAELYLQKWDEDLKPKLDDGFRSWEAEWEDARKNLDKCPGVTAPIRLTKLQLALGGAALKLVKSIPAGTDDGYDIAIKKLRETYHNPVGLATALLNAAESDKKPRIHQEVDAHVKSLRAAMKEEDVELETFYYLHPILQRLSTKDSTSCLLYTSDAADE